jgi:hypothetical protein
LDKISGPLGLWPFPLLNLLLQILGSRSGVFTSPIRAENLEEIVWTDWRGRERRMTIHREVR